MGESSSENQSWKVLAALIIVCLAYLGYTGIENYSTTPKWIGLSSIVIGLLYIDRKQGIRWSWSLTIWSVFIVQYIIQTTTSYNPINALANSIPLIIAPLLVLSLFRNHQIKIGLIKFSVLLALITVPIILYGFYEVAELLASSDYTKTSSYGIRFSFGHKNQLAQFFTLLIPIYALGIALTKVKWHRILFIFSILLIYGFVTLLMNRTSLILLYGVYPFAALIYLIQIRFSKSHKNIAFGTLIGIAIAGVVFLFSIPEKIPLIEVWMNSESGNERLTIWRNSFELAKESPMFGHGSGNWKIEILRTNLERIGSENQVFFQRAHNEFIHLFVENGLIGIITLSTFFIYTLINVIRSSIEFSLKLFSITGLISFLIIANLSFPLERVELVFLLFLFLAPTFPNRKSTRLALRYLPTGLAIICLIFSIYWIRQERNFFKFRADNNIELTEKLSTMTIDGTSTPVAFYEGNYYFERQRYEEAAESFLVAESHNPHHIHVLNNLASSQSLIGKIDESKETYKRLFEVDSLFVEGLMNAASVHFNSGNVNQALEYLLKIPASKEPENFHLFVVTIVRAKLQELKTTMRSNPEKIDYKLKSDNKLIELFKLFREGKSIEDLLN